MSQPDDPAYPVEKVSIQSGQIYPAGYLGGLTKRELMAIHLCAALAEGCNWTTVDEWKDNCVAATIILTDHLILGLNGNVAGKKI